VEGRRLTKVNVIQDNTHQTQGWNDAVSTGLDRIRLTAKKDKDVKFTALMHHVTIDRLRSAFKATKKNAAPGIDGETWATYEENLEGNLSRLHQKAQSGGYQPKPSRRVYIPKADGLLLKC
jgi:retron-type reverse transcriptase